MSVDVADELRLWRWVLRFAQEELERGDLTEPHLRSLSRRWLISGTKSYFMVCALAGLSRIEAEYLREQSIAKWGKSWKQK